MLILIDMSNFILSCIKKEMLSIYRYVSWKMHIEIKVLKVLMGIRHDIFHEGRINNHPLIRRKDVWHLVFMFVYKKASPTAREIILARKL